MDGWRFRGRRMLRYMGLMNFPRYINREARDFFFLTLRHVLPGERLAGRILPAEPGEGEWVVKGLPQHGWPYALATTWLRPERERAETKVRLLRVDPSTVRTAEERDGDDKLVLALRSVSPPAAGTQSLWLGPKGFSVGESAPDPAARHVAAARASSSTRAAAAAGIDAAGMLIYAEVATAHRPEADGALLERLLASLGVQKVLLFDKPLGAALGGDRDLAGHPVPLAKGGVRWIRRARPGARRIFPDTEIVPPKVWYPLQARRVRYFRKPKPEPGASEGTAAAPEAPSESPP
jgi:hypothetical protein